MTKFSGHSKKCLKKFKKYQVKKKKHYHLMWHPGKNIYWRKGYFFFYSHSIITNYLLIGLPIILRSKIYLVILRFGCILEVFKNIIPELVEARILILFHVPIVLWCKAWVENHWCRVLWLLAQVLAPVGSREILLKYLNGIMNVYSMKQIRNI